MLVEEKNNLFTMLIIFLISNLRPLPTQDDDPDDDHFIMMMIKMVIIFMMMIIFYDDADHISYQRPTPLPTCQVAVSRCFAPTFLQHHNVDQIIILIVIIISIQTLGQSFVHSGSAEFRQGQTCSFTILKY